MYLHDGSGAVTNATIDGEGIFAAQYDALGRIASLGGSGFVPTAFAYDAVGNRVRAGGCIWIPDHDDPLKRPLLECDEDGAPVRAYVWGAGRLLGFVELGGSGFVPTALTVAHCDEQGSVIALSSAAGTILHTAHFGPHGEDWGATGSNPTPFAWLGGLGVTRQLSTPSPQLPTHNSQLSTLYLSRHRLYAPTLRRFLSSDPLGLSGGLNLYAYCSGDPLTYVDPLGLSPWTRIGGFFQMIGGSIEAATGYGFAAFTATTGLGTALGVAVGLHGTDNALAGYYTMMNGTEQTTLTSQGLQSLGVSPDTARGIDAGIGMGATWGLGMAASSIETAVSQLSSLQNSRSLNNPIFQGISDDMLVHFSQARNLANIKESGIISHGGYSYYFRVGDVREMTIPVIKGLIGPLAHGGENIGMAVFVSPEAAVISNVGIEYMTFQNSVPWTLIRMVP